jgi:hypothetical protein
MRAKRQNACRDCVSYAKGVCWLHGVGKRGATCGRPCFRARSKAEGENVRLQVRKGGSK